MRIKIINDNVTQSKWLGFEPSGFDPYIKPYYRWWFKYIGEIVDADIYNLDTNKIYGNCFYVHVDGMGGLIPIECCVTIDSLRDELINKILD